jgi:hypothetical protein
MAVSGSRPCNSWKELLVSGRVLEQQATVTPAKDASITIFGLGTAVEGDRVGSDSYE